VVWYIKCIALDVTEVKRELSDKLFSKYRTGSGLTWLRLERLSKNLGKGSGRKRMAEIYITILSGVVVKLFDFSIQYHCY